jgi:hypothetical protein
MNVVFKEVSRKGYLGILFNLIICATPSLAQDTTLAKTQGRRALQICINDAVYGNFNITYTSFYKKNRAYELMVGYRIGIKSNEFIFGSLNDPIWCYNQFALRFGNRFYNSEGLYFSPMITAIHGFYNDLLFSEYQGRKNYYPLISRDKTGIGGIAKFGFTPPPNKRIVVDIYLGVGYRISYINEKIVNPDVGNSTSFSNHWKNEPTFHVGLQIGLILSKNVNTKKKINSITEPY